MLREESFLRPRALNGGTLSHPKSVFFSNLLRRGLYFFAATRPGCFAARSFNFFLAEESQRGCGDDCGFLAALGGQREVG